LCERGGEQALGVLEEVRTLVVDRCEVVIDGGAELRPVEELDTALVRIARAPQELRRRHVEAVGHLQRHRRCAHDHQISVGNRGPRIVEDDNSFEGSCATDADRFECFDHREQLPVGIPGIAVDEDQDSVGVKRRRYSSTASTV